MKHSLCHPLAVLIAVFSLLFMQAAMASYHCPLPKAAPCLKLDMDQPTLCHLDHDKQDLTLSAGTTPAFDLPVFVPGSLVSVLRPAGQWGAGPVFVRPVCLRRSTAPPIAIQNCCFRF